jgi:hypothetical protein
MGLFVSFIIGVIVGAMAILFLVTRDWPCP